MPAERADKTIGIQCACPHDFRERAASYSTGKLHLPEAILRVYESLRHEEIVGVRGVDVGDAISVPVDFDGFLQSGQFERAACFREWTPDEHNGRDY